MASIASEQESVAVYTKGNLDEYGQYTKSDDYSVMMTFKRFTHSTVEDPRYNKVVYLGLTKSVLNDKQYVVRAGITYKVIQITLTPKWNVVYLANEY